MTKEDKREEDYLTGEVLDGPEQDWPDESGGKEQISPLTLIRKVVRLGIDGAGPFIGARELAEQYLKNEKYVDNFERINALVKWEITKNFTSGFITNLGGILTLPAAIPAAISTSWVLQIRMVAAMAYLGGYNINEPSVRMLILLSLLGKGGREVFSSSMLDLPHVLRKKILTQLPKKTIWQFNHRLSAMLMRKAAERGFAKISKIVPIIGGILGGSLDLKSCKETADTARSLFQLNEGNLTSDTNARTDDFSQE